MNKNDEREGQGKTDAENNALESIYGLSGFSCFDTKSFRNVVFENLDLQRRLGFEKLFYDPGMFPDVKAKLVSYENSYIDLTFEFNAATIQKTEFELIDCKLIISYVRPFFQRTYKGIPIWSFYEYRPSLKKYFYCLDSDINTNFEKLKKINMDEEDDL